VRCNAAWRTLAGWRQLGPDSKEPGCIMCSREARASKLVANLCSRPKVKNSEVMVLRGRVASTRRNRSQIARGGIERVGRRIKESRPFVVEGDSSERN